MKNLKKFIIITVLILIIIGISTVSASAKKPEIKARLFFQDVFDKFREKRKNFSRLKQEKEKNSIKKLPDIEKQIFENRKEQLNQINEILARPLAIKIESVKSEEDLKKISGELKKYRKNIPQTRKSQLLPLIEKFEKNIIDNAETRNEKIKNKISELKNNGKDVTSLEIILNSANTKIASIKNQVIALKNSIENSDAEKNLSNKKLPEIKIAIDSLKTQLKEVYKLFQEIAEKGNML
ncbi:MAG: hypothetical protein HYV52_02725 [Parcubacteria group bacterium]|nr:hypothetical protein [Parcubacteria group bacterium]